MYKRDTWMTLITFCLAGLLLSSTSISVRAEQEGNYWTKVSEVLKDLSADMTELGAEATSFGKEETTKSATLEKAKQHREEALKLLKRIIELNPEAPDPTLHAKMVNAVSNWYLASLLWQEGLEEGSQKKMRAVEPIVNVISREAKLFSTKAKGN